MDLTVYVQRNGLSDGRYCRLKGILQIEGHTLQIEKYTLDLRCHGDKTDVISCHRFFTRLSP